MQPITINEAKRRIDKSLQEFFEGRRAEANDLDSSYGRLWEAMEKTCLAGGKRLRPYMFLLAYQAFGGKRLNDVLEIAAAQELLHMSLLIHDDIIDRDYTRHGVDNVSGQYRKHYNKAAGNDVNHHADSAALLAGDLLLTYAHALVNESKVDSGTRKAISEQLQHSIFAVGGGQLMDTESSFADWQHINPLKIARYKTAEYSFVGPLVSGALAADAPLSATKSLEQFGNNLGIAFQMTDDTLGSFGDEAVTGKSVNSDIKQAKKTFLLIATYKKASQEQRKFLDKTLSSNVVSDMQADKIKTIMKSTGAKAEVEALAESYKAKAVEELTKLNLEPNYQKAFQKFAENITSRSS